MVTVLTDTNMQPIYRTRNARIHHKHTIRKIATLCRYAHLVERL